MKAVKAFLLRILTKRRSTPFIAAAARSFVFLRYDRIGDLIVSLPLVKALKQRFPTTKMILIGSEVNAPVGKYCGLFDEIITKPNSQLFAWIIILLRLRLLRISVTFDLNHSVTPHTLIACLAIGSKHVATPYKDGRWGVSGRELELFDLMPTQHIDKYNRPIAETYLDIARLLGCHVRSASPYPLAPAFTYYKTEKTIILNHRGSRSSMRLLDSHLVRIAKMVQDKLPSYMITMVPEQSDYEHIEHLTKGLANVKILPPSPTIIPVIEAVKNTSLVITPDTALVHIAAAFSKPLIAVYANAPELFNQWKPLNTAQTVTLFSTDSVSLVGYSFDELSKAISKLTVDFPICNDNRCFAPD